MSITRRDCLVFGASALASSCSQKKNTGYPGYALIATSGEQSVAVVDLLTFELAPPIYLGAAPTAVIPGHTAQRNYILTPASGSVHVVNQSRTVVAKQKLADELSEVRVSADGRTLIALSTAGRELIFADAGTLRILRRMKLQADPVAMDVSVDGNIAVTLGTTASVELFGRDGAHHRIALQNQPGAVRFRIDGKLVIVSQPQARSLAVLNVPDLQLIATLPLAMEPQNLCFTKPDGGQLFVTGEGMDAVAIVFPYRTLEVEQTILAGRDPGVMACSSVPRYLFVASASGSDLTILAVDSRKLIGLVEVGLQPRFIAITPDNGYALILNEASGDLAVIRIPAIHQTRGKNGVALFTLLPVGSKPIHAAIIARA